MFYDRNLMNSAMLVHVWKLANNMSAQNVEECNLPKICTELDAWVSSDAAMPNRRLSLRASSHLIGGAAKLYKRGIHELFDDINKLDEEIILRRKRGYLNYSSTPVNSESSESVAAPEKMRRQVNIDFDSSISPKKRSRIELKPLSKIPQRLTMSRSSTDTMSSSNKVNSNKEDGYIRDNNNNSDLNVVNTGRTSTSGNDVDPGIVLDPVKVPEIQRKDREVQTSPILRPRKRPNGDNRSQDGFDKNLPFGYILIHDSYESRIPSKIIFTSINNDVKNFI